MYAIRSYYDQSEIKSNAGKNSSDKWFYYSDRNNFVQHTLYEVIRALVTLYIELPGIVGGSEKKAQKYAAELLNLSKVDGYLAKGYIDVYFERYQSAEKNYSLAHKIGNSKTTFEKLYDLYLNKLKDAEKAKQLKKEFNS